MSIAHDESKDLMRFTCYQDLPPAYVVSQLFFLKQNASLAIVWSLWKYTDDGLRFFHAGAIKEEFHWLYSLCSQVVGSVPENVFWWTGWSNVRQSSHQVIVIAVKLPANYRLCTILAFVQNVHITCSLPDFHVWRWKPRGNKTVDSSSSLPLKVCKCETIGYF